MFNQSSMYTNSRDANTTIVLSTYNIDKIDFPKTFIAIPFLKVCTCVFDLIWL